MKPKRRKEEITETEVGSGCAQGRGWWELSIKGPQGTSWGDGDVLYLALDGGYAGIYIIVKSLNSVLKKWAFSCL